MFSSVLNAVLLLSMLLRDSEALKSADECIVCSTSRSPCHIISGVFTRNKLPVGRHIVTTIHRTACKINITAATLGHSNLALATTAGDEILNGQNPSLANSHSIRAAGTAFLFQKAPPQSHDNHKDIGGDDDNDDQDSKDIRLVSGMQYILADGPVDRDINLLVVKRRPDDATEILYTYIIPKNRSNATTHRTRHNRNPRSSNAFNREQNASEILSLPRSESHTDDTEDGQRESNRQEEREKDKDEFQLNQPLLKDTDEFQSDHPLSVARFENFRDDSSKTQLFMPWQGAVKPNIYRSQPHWAGTSYQANQRSNLPPEAYDPRRHPDAVYGRSSQVYDSRGFESQKFLGSVLGGIGDDKTRGVLPYNVPHATAYRAAAEADTGPTEYEARYRGLVNPHTGMGREFRGNMAPPPRFQSSYLYSGRYGQTPLGGERAVGQFPTYQQLPLYQRQSDEAGYPSFYQNPYNQDPVYDSESLVELYDSRGPQGQQLMPRYHRVPEKNSRVFDDGVLSEERFYRAAPPITPKDELAYHQIPDVPATYSWKISGFTNCTRSCGGGTQSTLVVCVKGGISPVQVTDENCRESVKPTVTNITCNNKPCQPSWEASEWGTCSTTCDPGKQVRRVECSQRVSGAVTISISASRCLHEVKPETERDCNTDKPCFDWKAKEWTECSAACGKGRKTREVVCESAEGRVVHDSKCIRISRPKTLEGCEAESCSKSWYFSRWSKQCSSDCGDGVYSRKVHCGADDHICNELSKPSVTKECRSEFPCGGSWFTSSWSPCQVSCGAGIKSREVVCVKKVETLIVVVGDENCLQEEKPAIEEPCASAPCQPQWFVTDWSECSRTCNTGLQTRETKCLDANQRPSQSCDPQEKPELKQICGVNPCIPRFAKNTTQPLIVSCRDQLDICKAAVQSRLCRYNYYQEVCCFSCSSRGFDDAR